MGFAPRIDRLPKVRGRLVENAPLAPYSWFRVGGPAQVLFMPRDEADLALFLSGLTPDIPVTVLGAASNTLIRDGGVPGVVIRLGPAFAKVEQTGPTSLKAGAACLDSLLAKQAARFGIGGLEFFATIPGMIGGALRMNAGCYGGETKDVIKSVIALDRRGRRLVMSPDEMGYSYRHCAAPQDLIFVEAEFEGRASDPSAIQAKIEALKANRAASQPLREKTGGSTFKNPDPDISGGRSAWQCVEAVGGRGLKIGGAHMSRKHCNFMINDGTASAADLEALGEEIRARTRAQLGFALEWEIRRIGVEREK